MYWMARALFLNRYKRNSVHFKPRSRGWEGFNDIPAKG